MVMFLRRPTAFPQPCLDLGHPIADAGSEPVARHVLRNHEFDPPSCEAVQVGDILLGHIRLVFEAFFAAVVMSGHALSFGKTGPFEQGPSPE